MKQTTFASLAFDRKKKRTRRECFPTNMDNVVSWASLLAAIEPMHRFAGLDLTDDAMPDEARSSSSATSLRGTDSPNR